MNKQLQSFQPTVVDNPLSRLINNSPKATINNKWTHGDVKLVLSPDHKSIMVKDGVFYLYAIMDTEIGKEIFLTIYDPTDFIFDLKRLSPFRFFISGLAVNTSFGQVFSYLFWVSDPKRPEEAFAIYDKPVDISKSDLVDPWLMLARQTHVHLLLVDKNHEVKGFYEFINIYNIDQGLKGMAQLNKYESTNYETVLEEYFATYSLEQLYKHVKNRQ